MCLYFLWAEKLVKLHQYSISILIELQNAFFKFSITEFILCNCHCKQTIQVLNQFEYDNCSVLLIGILYIRTQKSKFNIVT
jgi:hypothetical protein